MAGDPSTGRALPARIGRYVIQRKLGEGGMGVVYAAHDDQLDRLVALKTMSALARDEAARARFWREARAAARVSHPNVCQIHEIGDSDGELFIAMELLEGDALADRLRGGPMSPSVVVPIGLEILAALSALHARGIVHRDLKPSNVFLTPHGVKLLDFGLALPTGDEGSIETSPGLTRPGIVVGTPRYIAPEQLSGATADARSDLFAVGAVLFEMLAGRPAFGGPTVVDVLHATLHEQPPALTGSPAIAAVDRVIRRALAKRPSERPASADAMAADLRGVRSAHGSDAVALARPLTRIVALPFRVLRADPESDFLAFSLPDAIAMSLSSIDSVIVRSSATAARFAAETPDLKALAAEADVDSVVLGTLLRAGDRLRVTAQLVEAPSGTLLTSHTVQSSLGDLFQLQDEITRRIVDALSLPLTSHASPAPDAPRDAGAYELYLRANELARTYGGLVRARELYEQCVALDPAFAPAWAHLGRCHRVIGKYIDGTGDSERLAQEALERALALNPRLTVAHKYFAHLEADIGQATRAVMRLLGEADRHGNDPELFAGLVQACRYCGLFDEALAAHAEARRLDPTVATSIEQTLLMRGDIERLLEIERPAVVAGADEGIRIIGLGLAGRRDEARAMLMKMRQGSHIPAFHAWTSYLLAWLDRRPSGMAASQSLGPLKINDDPEAIFQEGWLQCDVGEHEVGLGLLRRAIDKGYFPALTLANRPQFDAIREDAAFQALVEAAEDGRRRALDAFREAGGRRLLGQ